MYASLGEPVSRRLTGTHAVFTFEQVRAHCERIAQAPDRCDYGIMLAGELIGEVVLNAIDAANRSASLRIAIWPPERRNQGFGSEAIALVIDHGFRSLGLNRIELEVYAFNPLARHVYEKLGFRLEGVKREALLWEGAAVDALTMSILARDYFQG